MDYREYQSAYFDYLEHHGIKGMHWGIRRYQNPDGTLTVKGRKRYAKDFNKLDAQASQDEADSMVYRKRGDEAKAKADSYRKEGQEGVAKKYDKEAEDFYKKADKHAERSKEYRSEIRKGLEDTLSRGTNVDKRTVFRPDKRIADENVKAALAGTGIGMLLSPAAGAAAGVLMSDEFYNNNWKKYREVPYKINGSKFTLTPSEGEKGEVTISIDLNHVEEIMKAMEAKKQGGF